MEHVVVDLARDGLPFDVTLVVANQTVAAGPLSERLHALAGEGPRRFIIVVPQAMPSEARASGCTSCSRRSRPTGSSPPA